MKINKSLCAAFAASALPFAAFAVDTTQDNTRYLQDPTFLPMQGQIYGATTYDYTRTTSDTDDFTGAPQASHKDNNNLVGQTLWYGVTNDLTLRAHMDYDPSNHATRDIAGGGSTEQESRGWEDPTFGLTYRLIDPQHQQSPVSFDLLASYSPDFFHAKNATAADDGNVARGGQAATFGAALGYETHDFTIQGIAGTNWIGDQSAQNATTGLDSTQNSYWNYYTGINTETRFGQFWSLDLDARYQLSHDFDVTNPAGVTHTNSPGNITSLTAAVNYAIIPQRLVGTLDYTYDMYSASGTDFAVVANDTSTHNHHSNALGAGVQYLF